jgi:hypothetical protein
MMAHFPASPALPQNVFLTLPSTSYSHLLFFFNLSR